MIFQIANLLRSGHDVRSKQIVEVFPFRNLYQAILLTLHHLFGQLSRFLIIVQVEIHIRKQQFGRSRSGPTGDGSRSW